MIVNISGHTLRKPMEVDLFLPDFLKEHKPKEFVPKTLEQQLQESAMFKAKLLSLKKKPV